MKKILSLATVVITMSLSASAQSWTPVISNVRSGASGNSSVVYQKGYTRSNGTYVQGHYKTVSNKTNWDNFSTRGNINTFTGSIGSRARDYTPKAYNYGSGRTIYTGSRGGQYYINSCGTKTYVPKRSTKSLW